MKFALRAIEMLLRSLKCAPRLKCKKHLNRGAFCVIRKPRNIPSPSRSACHLSRRARLLIQGASRESKAQVCPYHGRGGDKIVQDKAHIPTTAEEEIKLRQARRNRVPDQAEEEIKSCKTRRTGAHGRWRICHTSSSWARSNAVLRDFRPPRLRRRWQEKFEPSPACSSAPSFRSARGGCLAR